jgi:sortase A
MTTTGPHPRRAVAPPPLRARSSDPAPATSIMTTVTGPGGSNYVTNTGGTSTAMAGGQVALRPTAVVAPASRGLVIDLNPLLEPQALARIGRGLLIWLIALILGACLVAYFIGSVFAIRDQRKLTSDIQLQSAEAAGAVKNSLGGAVPITVAPETGSAVGLLQIPKLRLQQAISEGADSQTLRAGPGHVPGTSGLGQPGNSVVVGRHAAFGGPFGRLSELKVGDKMIVTTPQGKSVYTVTAAGTKDVSADTYAPAPTDQLTLLSSTTWWPFSTGSGTVVTAKMDAAPFTPTPQNGGTERLDGRHGDNSAWPLLILELMAIVVAAVAATVLYRRWSAPATYLLTTPALLALMVFGCLTLVRLLPGWF